MADVDLEVSCSDNLEMRASEIFSDLMGHYKQSSPPWGSGSIDPTTIFMAKYAGI